MKILITGGTGQLGQELQNVINHNCSEIGPLNLPYKIDEVISADVDTLDITNYATARNYIKELQPDIIFNCAAYTNVDDCEKNQDIAFQINSFGAANIAKIASEISAELIHVSTDYIFSGTKEDESPYKEWDIANPQGIYGKSKYLGEQWVQQFNPKTYIVRTAWLYGYHGHNFVKTILKAGKEKGALKVVNDQKGNPTNANDLAHHLLQLPFTGLYGTYHCTNEGTCSWYDFANEIIKLSGINCSVSPCSTEEFPRPAQRPAYSSLDNMMLRNTIGNQMRPWQEAIASYIKNINS